MIAIERILTSATAPWCGWMMLAMLICMVLAEVCQPGVVKSAPAAILAPAERTYKESPNNFLGQFFSAVYQIGLAAMAIYVIIPSNVPFLMGKWLILCGIVLAVLLVKMLLNVLLDYAFEFSKHFASPYEQYSSVATTVCMLLYPSLLLLFRLGSTVAATWVIGVIVTAFVLLVSFRLMRTYLISFPSMIFILLYIATMEIIPVAATITIASQIID